MLQVCFHWPNELTIFLTYCQEELSSKKRYREAAQVFLDYCNDNREAVIALTSGNMFSEARRIVTHSLRWLYGTLIPLYLRRQVSLNSVPELLEDILYPAALESRAQISEDIGEMREQLRKQVNRLHELRLKKVEEPGSHPGSRYAYER